MYVCWVGVGVGVGEEVGDGAVRGRGEVRVMRIDLKFQLIYIYINPSNRWSGKKSFKHKSPTPINSRTKLWPL